MRVRIPSFAPMFLIFTLVLVQLSLFSVSLYASPLPLKVPLPGHLNRDKIVKLIKREFIQTEYDNYRLRRIAEDMEALGIKDMLENPFEFPDEVMEYANQYQQNNLDFDGIKDLVHIPFISIDNDDSMDIDQAMYIEHNRSTDHYTLLYAISNAEYFLHDISSPLAQYFFQKGVTTYNFAGVFPALPPHLSDNLCSLRAKELRRSLVIEIHFDKFGQRIDSETSIYPAKIKNRIQLSYKQVAHYYDRGEDRYVYNNPITKKAMIINPALASDAEYIPTLDNLESLGKKLVDLRKKRHVMNFPEREVSFSVIEENGSSYLVVTPSHRVITDIYNEEISVNANTAVAKFLSSRSPKRIGIHRNHPAPEVNGLSPQMKKKVDGILKSIHDQIPSFHVTTKDDGDFSQDLLANMEQIKESSRDEKDYLWAQQTLMKMMPFSSFSIYEEGHFGLQLKEYDQTTAPMRRASDVINHLSIKDELSRPEWKLNENKLEYFVDMLNAAEQRENAINRHTNNYFLYLILTSPTFLDQEIKVNISSWDRENVTVSLTDAPCLIVKIPFAKFVNDANVIKDKYLHLPLPSEQLYMKLSNIAWNDQQKTASFFAGLGTKEELAGVKYLAPQKKQQLIKEDKKSRKKDHVKGKGKRKN